eukprot:g1370.t1
MEIYNECINDLLVPSSKNLDIFDHPKKGCVISGLLEEIVTSPKRIMDLLAAGDAPSDATRVSTLSLTDLAGSESLRISGAVGTQRKEGSFINRSLLTLSMVIRALSSKKKGGRSVGHVPYRNSKLTRILRSSLSGNSRVGIVCCVTPGSENVEETINTLDFASRAKKIEHELKINEVVDERALLQQYRKEISDLRAQLDILRSGDGAEDLMNPSKTPAALRPRRSSGEFTQEQMEEMLELEDMIDRLDHVILSANSVPPSPPRKKSGAFDFSAAAASSSASIKRSPRFRRRSGSFQSADMAESSRDSSPEKDRADEADESEIPLSVNDLTEIKVKLASLYKKKKQSKSLKKTSTARKMLFESVQHADSLFLQRELRERDDLISKMVTVMDAMESKYQEIETNLKIERETNAELREDLRRLRRVLDAREHQLEALRREDPETETF